MSLVGIALALLLAADVPPTKYVEASTAIVRQAPQADARIVGELPIATPLRALASRGDWIEVKAESLRGWVFAPLLSSVEPTRDRMMAAYRAASDLGARRKWIERAAALAPGDVAVLEQLVAVLRQAGDEAPHARAVNGLLAARLARMVKLTPPERVFWAPHHRAARRR